MAIERFAYRGQGAKANALHFSRFQQRQVLLGNANLGREFLGSHFPACQHDIKGDDDLHRLDEPLILFLGASCLFDNLRKEQQGNCNDHVREDSDE